MTPAAKAATKKPVAAKVAVKKPASARPAFKGAKSPAGLAALYELVAAQLVGCACEPLRSPKVGCGWSNAEGYWVATVSEFRGQPMFTINANVLGRPALAPSFKALKAFHDGGNSLLFATVPVPWPAPLVTLVKALGAHVAAGS